MYVLSLCIVECHSRLARHRCVSRFWLSYVSNYLISGQVDLQKFDWETMVYCMQLSLWNIYTSVSHRLGAYPLFISTKMIVPKSKDDWAGDEAQLVEMFAFASYVYKKVQKLIYYGGKNRDHAMLLKLYLYGEKAFCNNCAFWLIHTKYTPS